MIHKGLLGGVKNPDFAFGKGVGGRHPH